MGTTQLTKFRNLALLRFQKPCLAEIPEGAAHRGSGKFQLFANGGNRRPALSILIGTVRKVNIDRYRTVRRIHVVQRIKHKKGAVAHVTAPLLFVESKNKRHVFVKIKACATDFLENQKFSMDL